MGSDVQFLEFDSILSSNLHFDYKLSGRTFDVTAFRIATASTSLILDYFTDRSCVHSSVNLNR